MATCLDIRLWIDDENSLGTRFSNIISAISEINNANWEGFRVTEAAKINFDGDYSGNISVDQLIEKTKLPNDANQNLEVLTPFNCWRFSGLNSERGACMLRLNVWGKKYGIRNKRSYDIEGDASISMHAGPFFELNVSNDSSEIDQVNKCVEENMAHLLNTVISIIININPRALKIFTDNGQFLPFNALLYYNDIEFVKRDLMLLDSLWGNGLPAYHMPSLKELNPSKEPFIFHPYRDVPHRESLFEKLKNNIFKTKRIELNHINEVINSGRFDFLEIKNANGIVILDFPFFLNAFMDEFYIRILEAV